VRCRHVLRQFPWLLGKDRIFKKHCLPSGKHLDHSVSGRHYDDRWRNTPGVFRKASGTFLISDLYRSIPTSYGNCRSALYPFYVLSSNAAFPRQRQSWDLIIFTELKRTQAVKGLSNRKVTVKITNNYFFDDACIYICIDPSKFTSFVQYIV